MKRVVRLCLPMAVAGVTAFGTASAAHAGSWVDTPYTYHTLAACKANGPAVMTETGGSAWACAFEEKFENYYVRVFMN